MRSTNLLRAATIGRVGVKDTVAVAQENARAVQFACWCRHPPRLPFRSRAVVVGGVDDSLVKGDAEVEVEATAEARIPGKRPAHRVLEPRDLLDRRSGHDGDGRIPFVQMLDISVLVDAASAAHATLVPARIEHVVVDDELVAAFEEIKQRPCVPVRNGEAVILDHLDHRQTATLGGEFVPCLGERFLLIEQRDACMCPRITTNDFR